jgi:hypothetical protein
VTDAESAADLFRALRRQIASGEVALRCDFARLRHMDSPVGSEAEMNRWAYGAVALSLLALWRGGWWAAAAVAAISTLLYYTAGFAHARRNIRRRIDARALESLDEWQKLWRFGGVALVTKSGEVCAAPQGNWMALVRQMRDGAGN